MIYLETGTGQPLYEQIYRQYLEQILSGQLPAGSKLPPTRKLSEELAVGRNTVDRAYQQLKAEGYVDSVTGSGFVVNAMPQRAERYDLQPPIPEAPVPSADFVNDFIYGSMDNQLFPYVKWRECVRDSLLEMENARVIAYPEKMGELRLRTAICRYLRQARNVKCSPQQIVITCGQQHSMEILANVFCDGGTGAGKSFVMEEPGYDGIRRVFENRHFEVSGVPVEEDGISLSPLQDRHGQLLYLTPSHQFPSGPVLSAAKRYRLLTWAQATDSFIVEDDYDSELRYYTNPIPSMQSMDTAGRIIYTGTFSKALAPSMRVAYIVFPPELLERYQRYYFRYNSQVSALHQMALAIFMEKGYYEQQVNRVRTFCRRKMEALLAAIEENFGDLASVQGGEAGLHILADLRIPGPDGNLLTQEEMIRRAADAGIRIYSTRPFYQNPALCPPHQLLMGISTVSESDMGQAMQRLRQALGGDVLPLVQPALW